MAIPALIRSRLLKGLLPRFFLLPGLFISVFCGQAATNPHDSATTNHWAFQPVRAPAAPVPLALNWVRTPIDNFVLEELEQRHLQPTSPADRRTLIRRVSYDLLGLPPSYEEVEAFIHDSSPDAYEKLVEKLLA